jgi:hypothetical protein
MRSTGRLQFDGAPAGSAFLLCRRRVPAQRGSDSRVFYADGPYACCRGGLSICRLIELNGVKIIMSVPYVRHYFQRSMLMAVCSKIACGTQSKILAMVAASVAGVASGVDAGGVGAIAQNCLVLADTHGRQVASLPRPPNVFRMNRRLAQSRFSEEVRHQKWRRTMWGIDRISKRCRDAQRGANKEPEREWEKAR